MKTKEEIEQLIIDAEEEFRIFERMGADTGRKVLDLLTEAVKNNGISPCVSGRLSQQSELVRQRLQYHFAKPEGGWNIEWMKAPFMKEFLNEVQKLVDLSK